MKMHLSDIIYVSVTLLYSTPKITNVIFFIDKNVGKCIMYLIVK